MRRREAVVVLGGLAAWPLAAGAQQATRVARLGILMGIADDAEGHVRLAALYDALHELGWIKGKNLEIDEHWGAGNETRRFPSKFVRRSATHGRNIASLRAGQPRAQMHTTRGPSLSPRVMKGGRHRRAVYLVGSKVMSWLEYNRNWMLVVGVIIVLLIIAWVSSQYYHPAPR
ncbi:MAG TPA: hypothetical protein VJ728_14205 [Candidatus Binataceae bacterium]|nr:hypothetical protein [Candidatus Binataceae bacterium]